MATGARRVAVIIEPAYPARIASLLMAAYSLSELEQEVSRLVRLVLRAGASGPGIVNQ